MELIIIRGNAFSGKSRLADRLGEVIHAKVLHVDYLKTSARKNNPLLDIAGICSSAYSTSTAKLKEYLTAGEEIVIVEELGKDKELIDKLRDFIDENKIKVRWILLSVDLDELYKRRENKITEFEREDRVLKINKEELPVWQKEIESHKIPGEITIDNNSSEEEGFLKLSEAVRVRFANGRNSAII